MKYPLYFDQAATSFPKAPGVPEAVFRFLSEAAGNPGRGGHELSRAGMRMVEQVREETSHLLGANPERLLFGPSATFWLNTVMHSLLRPGDRVVISALEHNAVLRPLRALQKERNLEVEVVEGAPATGVPTAAKIAERVDAGPTRAVILTHASNVSGMVTPVREIASAVAGVPVIVDGAQTVGSLPWDFRELGVAALIGSGHKGLLGPPGVGLLLLAEDFSVEPLIRGGTGSRSESERMPELLPDRLEAGTLNTAGIAGLGAAVRWLLSEGIDRVHRREKRLIERLAEGLAPLPFLRLPGYGREGPRVGTLAVTCRGMDDGDLAAWLDREKGIMARIGLHCAPAAHRRLGTFPEGAIRLSVGPFTTDEHVDAVVAAFVEAREIFR